MADYRPPKVSEQRMKTQAGKNDGSDIFMDASRPVGAQRNSASSPDEMFGREFSAESDLATMIQAGRIRRDRVRYGRVLALKERMSSIRVNKDRGDEPINERGPTDHTTSRGGSPARSNNAYDKIPAAGRGTTGKKMDGGKGRW